MSQFSRATPLNRAEDHSLLQGDLVRVLLKKRFAMLPQTIGDGRHGFGNHQREPDWRAGYVSALI